MCGAFAEPSDGLEPSTPPYHGLPRPAVAVSGETTSPCLALVVAVTPWFFCLLLPHPCSTYRSVEPTLLAGRRDPALTPRRHRPMRTLQTLSLPKFATQSAP